MSIIDHQAEYTDELLARMDSVIADLSELSLSSLSLDQLNMVLVRETALASQIQALQLAALQEAESAGMSLRFGNRILTTHLALETHQPVQALGAARAMALWLNDFPTLHTGLLTGALSWSHLSLSLIHISEPTRPY